MVKNGPVWALSAIQTRSRHIFCFRRGGAKAGLRVLIVHLWGNGSRATYYGARDLNTGAQKYFFASAGSDGSGETGLRRDYILILGKQALTTLAPKSLRRSSNERLRILDTQFPRLGVLSEYASSEYLPSSPLHFPAKSSRRIIPTRSQPGCSPSDVVSGAQQRDSPDPDTNPGTLGRKRGISQVISSPPTQQSTRQPAHDTHGGQYQQYVVPFCTQRCVLGLRDNGNLDSNCPNVALHRRGQDGGRHPIDMECLVQLLKNQLDEDLDPNCPRFDKCGSSGAPFKITRAQFGYTVVGKGTTSRRWKEVIHEAVIYQLLQNAQGSAVPVFLGAIDLAEIYFLHGAGEIPAHGLGW
ncbi:hypothetical protein BDV25DRAFT_138741 [Aspergillus avenaceus]|uniref:Uncharacterized protein n=1 Tax=Aspergillus avenaceus TaxID=36643 RepID=A0A5N6U034_ASPAV|nr:hypothetical protein BDV25DRAFT_138741 [Aspergillus avenaceus]